MTLLCGSDWVRQSTFMSLALSGFARDQVRQNRTVLPQAAKSPAWALRIEEKWEPTKRMHVLCRQTVIVEVA